MRSLSLTVIVVTGVILLAGCSAAAPSGSSSGTVPSGSTPTASAQTEPAAQFPSTCGQLVSDVDAAAALGSSTPASPTPRYAPSALDPLEDARTRQSGSMICLWDAGASRLSLLLHRHADLLARGPYGEVGFFSGSPVDVGADRSTLSCATGCSMDAQIGDYLLSADIPDAAYRDKLMTLAAKVATRLRGGPVPDLWTAPSGSWPSALDCAAIEQSGGVAAALALGPLTVEDTTGAGSADTSVSPEIGHLGGITDCTWGDPSSSSGATLQTFAGGGWAVDRMLATTTLKVRDQTVVGATRAATVCGKDGRCALVVRIGVNALVLGDRQDVFGVGPAVSSETLVAAGPAVVAGSLAAAG